MVVDYVNKLEFYDADRMLGLFRVRQGLYVGYVINLRLGQKFDDADLFLWFHSENPSPYDGNKPVDETDHLDPPHYISLLLPVFTRGIKGATVSPLEASIVSAPSAYGSKDSASVTDGEGHGLFVSNNTVTINAEDAGITLGRDGVYIKGRVLFEEPSNTYGWFKKNPMAVIPSTVVTPFPDLSIDVEMLSKLIPGL